MMRQQTQKTLNDILDTMTGADGGVSFVRFRALIEEMDRQAEQGDEAAKGIIQVMLRFGRLIETAQRT